MKLYTAICAVIVTKTKYYALYNNNNIIYSEMMGLRHEHVVLRIWNYYYTNKKYKINGKFRCITRTYHNNLQTCIPNVTYVF